MGNNKSNAQEEANRQATIRYNESELRKFEANLKDIDNKIEYLSGKLAVLEPLDEEYFVENTPKFKFESHEAFRKFNKEMMLEGGRKELTDLKEQKEVILAGYKREKARLKLIQEGFPIDKIDDVIISDEVNKSQ